LTFTHQELPKPEPSPWSSAALPPNYLIKPEKTKVFDSALNQHMTKPMKIRLNLASHWRGPVIFLLGRKENDRLEGVPEPRCF
jgi:hypothetical protein